MATDVPKKKGRGLSAERLKALRRKHGLGEFRKARRQAAPSGSSARRNSAVDMTGSNGTYEVGLSPGDRASVERFGPQALQGSGSGIP